jgi:hypothetical protein
MDVLHKTVLYSSDEMSLVHYLYSIIHISKNVVVTATTGIASQGLRQKLPAISTIHKFVGSKDGRYENDELLNLLCFIVPMKCLWFIICTSYVSWSFSPYRCWKRFELSIEISSMIRAKKSRSMLEVKLVVQTTFL